MIGTKETIKKNYWELLSDRREVVTAVHGPRTLLEVSARGCGNMGVRGGREGPEV